MGILHVWLLHIGIFPVWIIPVWQTGLRRLIDVELRADHSALIVSATVPDKVAVFLQLLESRENGIGTFLAERRKTTGGELPAVVEGQHFREQSDRLEGQVLISQVSVAHDREVTGFIDAIDRHMITLPFP